MRNHALLGFHFAYCETFYIGAWIHFQNSCETTFFKTIYLPSEKGCTLKEKNLLHKFFPFRVDLFSDGTLYSGKQTGSSKLSPL